MDQTTSDVASTEIPRDLGKKISGEDFVNRYLRLNAVTHDKWWYPSEVIDDAMHTATVSQQEAELLMLIGSVETEGERVTFAIHSETLEHGSDDVSYIFKFMCAPYFKLAPRSPFARNLRNPGLYPGYVFIEILIDCCLLHRYLPDSGNLNTVEMPYQAMPPEIAQLTSLMIRVK